MHVSVVRQHCAQIEGFAFSHINNNNPIPLNYQTYLRI